MDVFKGVMLSQLNISISFIHVVSGNMFYEPENYNDLTKTGTHCASLAWARLLPPITITILKLHGLTTMKGVKAPTWLGTFCLWVLKAKGKKIINGCKWQHTSMPIFRTSQRPMYVTTFQQLLKTYIRSGPKSTKEQHEDKT